MSAACHVAQVELNSNFSLMRWEHLVQTGSHSSAEFQYCQTPCQQRNSVNHWHLKFQMLTLTKSRDKYCTLLTWFLFRFLYPFNFGCIYFLAPSNGLHDHDDSAHNDVYAACDAAGQSLRPSLRGTGMTSHTIRLQIKFGSFKVWSHSHWQSSHFKKNSKDLEFPKDFPMQIS